MVKIAYFWAHWQSCFYKKVQVLQPYNYLSYTKILILVFLVYLLQRLKTVFWYSPDFKIPFCIKLSKITYCASPQTLTFVPFQPQNILKFYWPQKVVKNHFPKSVQMYVPPSPSSNYSIFETNFSKRLKGPRSNYI
jgi:hypothetical protein